MPKMKPSPFNGDTSAPSLQPFSSDTSTPPLFNGGMTPPPPPSINSQQDIRQDIGQQYYIPSRKPDFVCPFCMRKIYAGDLLYFCKQCKNVYTEKEAKERLSRIKKQYHCCNNSITSQRICPNCRIEAENRGCKIVDLRIIPSEVYNVKNEFRVCMAGYCASGKTQYITQLMDYIVNYPLPGIDSTRFLDNTTQESVEAILYKYFEVGAPCATPRGYLEPLLFNIRKGKHSYVGVFNDISGEDFRENRDAPAARCIWNSKNILLIIDPAALPGLKVHPEVEKQKNEGKASSGRVVEPLYTYINLVRENQPEAEKFLKKVNLAIVFSKMDLFYDDEDFPEILKKESSCIAKGKFDAEETDMVSRAMESWLREKEGDNFLSVLKGYPNARIFGVSSGSLEEGKKPNRLLDPYLWFLYRNGVFK